MTINWKQTPDYQDCQIEIRPIMSLKPHERPSSWRIWKEAKSMEAGTETHLIYIAQDGLILDGHARWYAAKRLLGKNAEIPVQVKQLSLPA